MSNMRVGAIVQHLRQLMEEDRYRQASDGQLLQGILSCPIQGRLKS